MKTENREERGGRGGRRRGQRPPVLPGARFSPIFLVFSMSFCGNHVFFRLSISHGVLVANEDQYIFVIPSMSCTEEQCCFFGDR